MSESVTRLKELLFDSETQALAELSAKIDSVARAEAQSRDEIKRSVAEIFERVGTSESFTNSVSQTLDEALRRAEITKHSQLSVSLAPLVVTTIKTELRNSQDEMVEALYPITGRLVKAYVESAMKDLNDQMNRRLEQNPVMLRLQSLATGRSVAELALAGTQDFELEELFLIRRATGDLVAHWSASGASGREQLMSGVLAAVNEFANEAFAADQNSMRQIDIGGANVYLRGSPLYLVAAKCKGTAPKGIEQVLDDTFLAAIEKQNDSAGIEGAQGDLLREMGSDLKARIDEQKADISRPAGNPLKMLAMAIALPLLAWFGWSWYVDFANNRARTAAELVISQTAEMQGYIPQLHAADRGRILTVAGLVPSLDVKSKVLHSIGVVLPKTAIRDELAVVPGSDIDIPNPEPEIANIRRTVSGLETAMVSRGLERAADRTTNRLRQAEADLRKAAKTEREPAVSSDLTKSADAIAALLKEVTASRAALTRVPADGDTPKAVKLLGQMGRRMSAESSAVTAALSNDGAVANQVEPAIAAAIAGNANIESASEAMAAEAERLAAIASTAAIAQSLRPRQIAVPAAAPDMTPRERLENWTRSHAIFFSVDTDYRDSPAAAKTLDALVPLLKDAQHTVRIVGYTDEAGGQARNVPLAQDRAERVRQELILRGVSAGLLHAIGRADSRDLSSAQGATSPNRRVEFELAFEGEFQP